MSTSAPPPEKNPKATPLFWTWTRFTPGRNLCTSPIRMPLFTALLVIRSTMSTRAMTPATRANAARRPPSALPTEASDTGALACSALDDTDQERAHEVQDDDRHHRREVDRPQRRDEAAEQAAVGVRTVAQEVPGGCD